MGKPNGFRRLSRVDLKGFSRHSQNLILMAMERGGVGRVSNKGHAILRSPSGSTMSVSRTFTQNRGLQNTEAQWVRVFGDLPVEETQGSLALVPDPHPLVPPREHPMLECPVESCEAEFVTEGARYAHVHKEHYPCKQPGCFKVYDAPNKASGHYNVTHRRAELGKVPAECPVEGCDWTGKVTGLPGHAKKHPKAVWQKARAKAAGVPVKKKAAPKKKQSTVKAPTPPRERDLAAELDAALSRIADLENAMARLREALQ
jgi:hypothetical protein